MKKHSYGKLLMGAMLAPLSLTAQDLVITNVTVPEGPFIPGDTVTLVVEVTNADDPDTGAAVSAGSGFVVEADVGTLGASQSPPQNAEIAPGDAVEMNVIYEITEAIDNGSYAVTSVEVDATDVVGETDETNNLFSDAGFIEVEAFANLTITEVELSPGPYYPGDTVSFEVFYENGGDREADDFDLSLLVEAPPAGTNFEADATGLGPLEAGGVAAATLTGTIPFDNPNGTYEVTTTVDSGGTVNESAENDNTAELTFAIDTLPDLRIRSLDYEVGQWEGGDPVDFELVYENAPAFGAEKTVRVDDVSTQRYRVQVVLSTDSIFGNEDDYLLYDTYLQGDPDGGTDTGTGDASSNLLPGQDVTMTWTQMMPENYFGDYFVLARIDVDDNVTEFVEDNRRLNGNNTLYTVETAKITLLPGDNPKPVTYRASVDSGGNEGDGLSEQPDLSQDGRYTVFSTLSALSAADSNTHFDVYVRDNFTGEVELVSKETGISGRSGDSQYPAISADGRYIVFQSDSPDLVLNDSNEQTDIFRYDRSTGQLERVSVTDGGLEANRASFSPDISGDGQYVVFASRATNLTGETVTSGRSHIYVRDVVSGTTSLISLASGGGEADGHSLDPEISADGNFVVFTSEATDIAGAPDAHRNVYRVAVDGTGPVLLSQVPGGGSIGNGNSYDATISEDGSVVAFVSDATNLDTAVADSNGLPDVFVYDFGAGPTLERVVASNGNELNAPSAETPGDVGALEPAISADGRKVVFKTQSDNVLPFAVERSDGTTFSFGPYDLDGFDFSEGAIVGYSDLNSTNHYVSYAGSDVYLYDRDNPSDLEQISRNRFGYPAHAAIMAGDGEPSIPSSRNPAISGDGRYVAFASDARGTAGFAFGRNNTDPLDANGVRDIFLRDRRTGDSFSLTPPTVTLVEPAGDVVMVEGETVLLEATASANNVNGFIDRVEFYANGVLVGSSLRETHTMLWRPEQPGVYAVRAVAVDNDGARSETDAVQVTVGSAGAPTVSLTSPADGETVLVPDPIEITATAGDTDGIVQQVEFFINGKSVSADTEAPYAYSFTGTAEVAYGSGRFTIYAAATDDAGYTTFTDPVTVTLATGAGPTIGSVEPVDGSGLTTNEETELVVFANAGDYPIAEVIATINGETGLPLVESGQVGRYAANWTPSLLNANTVLYSVVDTQGNEDTLTVSYTVADGSAPVLSNLQPADGGTLQRNAEVSLRAEASDTDGTVVSVTASINGGAEQALTEATTLGVYEREWTPTLLGSNEVVITATDDLGNTTSSTLTYDVQDGTAPVVSLLSPDPADGDTDGIADTDLNVNTEYTLEVSASDADGSVAQVSAVINGGTALALTETGEVGRYAVAWTPTLIGEQEVVVTVVDDLGNSTSDSIVYNVVSGSAPTIASITPADGSDLIREESVTLQVEATAGTAPIAEVRAVLENGEVILLEEAGSLGVYLGEWLPLLSGDYSIEYEVLDGVGNTVTQTVDYTVQSGTAPTVGIVNPVDGSEYWTSQPLTVFALANDTDGVVESLIYRINGETVATLTDVPYVLEIGGENLDYGPGRYTLTAEAIDNNGNRTTSSPVQIVLKDPTAPAVRIASPDPADGSLVVDEERVWEITVTGSDAPVDTVEVYVNGVYLNDATPQNGIWVIPYTPVSLDGFSLQARAIQSSGGAFDSEAVDYTVVRGDAPVVTMNGPGAGLEIGQTAVISATVTDDDAIDQVNVYVNGELVGEAEPGLSLGDYEYAYIPEQTGTFTFGIEAIDELGNATLAETTSVVSSGAAPTVTLLSPDTADGDGDGIADQVLRKGETIGFRGNATDDGSIESVAFTVNDVPVEPVTEVVGGYTTEFTPSAAGLYTIAFAATDNRGNTRVDEADFVVEAGTPPSVSMEAPDPTDADGDGIADTPLAVNRPVKIEVSASDADGNIVNLEIRSGGESIGVAQLNGATGNYELEWIPTGLGLYEIEAIATDNAGNTAIAATQYEVVTSPAPTVSWVSPDLEDSTPADGIVDEPVLLGDELVFHAVITDSDGVADVEVIINESTAIELVESDFVNNYKGSWTPSIGGINPVQLRVEDESGNVVTEDYKINVLAPPSIKIEAPSSLDEDEDGVADIGLESGNSYDITVSASDGDGTVGSVEVFENGNSLGSANSIGGDEFVLTWEPVNTGIHTIRVRAEDNDGLVKEQEVDYLVSGGAGSAPTVEFLAPADGSRFLPGTILPVQVRAADADGLVTEVEFYLNGVLQITLDEAPFRTDIALPSEDEYMLVAVATDNDGYQTVSEPLTIRAGQPDDSQPRVVMDHPLPLGGGDVVNDVSVPSAMFLNATAVDPDGTIETVNFYINGQLIGEAEDSVGDVYSRFYDPNAPGSYILSAEAIDDDGNRSFSIPIALDVGPLESPMPKGEIYQPFAETVLGRSLGVFVETDAGLLDVNRVDFYANGVLIGSSDEPVNEGLFQLNWVPEFTGEYELRARVVQIDPGGNTWDNWTITDSASVTVTDPVGADDPSIELVSPDAAGQYTVLNPIELEAEALDPLGSIEEVRFYANGQLLDINNDGADPFGDDRYPYTMSFTPLSPGQYQFVAEMLSDRGIRLHSEPVTVTVEPSQTPEVTIDYPLDGSAVNVGRPLLITASTESTGGGAMNLSFFANGVPIGEDTTFPYSISWSPQSVGTYRLRVEAREPGTAGPEEGTEGVAVSEEVTVTVRGTDQPTGSIVSPAGINPTAGSDVLFEVNADDEDGFVEGVQYFVNGSPLEEGLDTEEPFATFWRPGSAGTYDLSALIIDNSGNQTVIEREVRVEDPVGIVPRVTLSVTASGNVTPGSRVMVRANVFDDDPETVGLTFFMNGEQIGTKDTSPPYFVILDPEIGTGNSYEIMAVASDEDGNSRADVLSPLYISDVTQDQPSIELVGRTEGETLTLGSRAPIRVEVSGGAVADLETVVFYANGREIGRDAEAPYSLDWIPDESGQVQLTAASLLNSSLYDHDDNDFTDEISVTPVNVASPVNVLVNEATGTLPSISLNVLPQRTNLAVGSQVMLYADAQDLDGNVESVSFFVDGEEQAVVTEAPFHYAYTVLREGRTTLNAEATDDDGNVVTSTFVELEATARVVTRTPGIELTVPNGGQEGSPMSLRASANGFVSGPEAVVFHVNGLEVGQEETAPYSYSWLANLSGEVSFFSTARQPLGDEQGTVVTTVSGMQLRTLTRNETPEITSVSVSHPNEDPETKPEPLVGETLTFRVEVADASPIESVELLRDGEIIAESDNSASPYEIPDTPPGLGSYQYSVLVTDSGGLQSQSEAIAVRVVRGIPPEVELVSPEAGAEVVQGSTLRLRATATDPDGSVTEVRFLVNGSSVGEVLTGRPYEFSYVPEQAGQYNIAVRARDNSGNLTESPVRTVTVSADNAPSLVLSNQLPGTVARLNQEIVWRLEADDDYGLSGVTVFRNGTELPSESEIPFEVTDTPPSVGLYRYEAEATDTAGNVTRTSPIEIEVTRGSAPQVSIVEPGEGSRYLLEGQAGGLVVRATAKAVDEPADEPAGQVVSVEVLLNGESVGTSLRPPYLVTANDFVEGMNILVAVATTDTGLEATSAELKVEGVMGTIPQILNFGHNQGSNTVLPGTVIGFVVDAIDQNGIEKVELLRDGAVVDRDLTAPYNLEDEADSVGTLVYKAVATNTDGNTEESEAIRFTVRLPDPINQDGDFVHQTHLDLLFREATTAELDELGMRLASGDLSRERLLMNLMKPEAGLMDSEYAVVRESLLAYWFLLDRWVERSALQEAVGVVRDSGLRSLVSSLMPEAEGLYVETVNADESYELVEEVGELPDVLSPEEEIEAYITYLFRKKYGADPTGQQMNLLMLHFRAEEREGFTAKFIEDVDWYATRRGYLTLGLGLSFGGERPPDDGYLRRADAASLLINLLRVTPTEEEVNALAPKLFVAQVREVLSDPRYEQRFSTPFPEMGSLAGGWKSSPWYGQFHTQEEPMIYHANWGWISFRMVGQRPDSFWFHDPQLGWLWTRAGLYPIVYDKAGARWLQSSGRGRQGTASRQFLDLGSGEWLLR